MPTGAMEFGNPVDLLFCANDVTLNKIAITKTIVVRQNMLVILKDQILIF